MDVLCRMTLHVLQVAPEGSVGTNDPSNHYQQPENFSKKTDVGHPVQAGCRVLMNPPNGHYLPLN